MLRRIGIIELFITALIWGTAFVAQSVGMDHVGPFGFNAIRYAIGAVILIPLILFRKTSMALVKKSVKGGILCGLALCVASLFQQFGILYTTVGKAGFITALYVIIVPFMGIFLGQKIGVKAWIAAVIAIIGFFLMCVSETMSVGMGDGLVLIGAFVWSIHIHLVDHNVVEADPVVISSIQFAVSAIICTVFMFIFETTTWNDVHMAMGPILYAGVMSCGVAYTLQIVGQQSVPPALACLILSLESVVSAISGWVILGESMSAIEITGCLLVFAGVILAQLPHTSSSCVGPSS